MLKAAIKKTLESCGVNLKDSFEHIFSRSIRFALKDGRLDKLVDQLRKIAPDISDQYTSDKEGFNGYYELKLRGMHAFQCRLMLRAIKDLGSQDLTVVDIGDSSGTHMRYLKELTRGTHEVDAMSVNLDPSAVERIKSKGLKAVLSRAEELDLGDKEVDLFTSFEMVEHLHNPAIFFRRLAKKARGKRMLITVPYQRQSRVGLYHIRDNSYSQRNAEQEHIFELSPQDWSILLLHSGWRVVYQEIYYQYPRRVPLLSMFLAGFWRKYDFEGFWGAILEKDISFSDHYEDWEE